MLINDLCAHSTFKNKDRAQPLGKLVSADTSKVQEHSLPHCCFVLQYFHYQLHSARFSRLALFTNHASKDFVCSNSKERLLNWQNNKDQDPKMTFISRFVSFFFG